MARGAIRVAAVGDLHCTRTSQGTLQPLFARMTESADLLLSREQYLHDTQQLGYLDARVRPLGGMTRTEATIWTAAIKKDES